jgi:hypothetical protein
MNNFTRWKIIGSMAGLFLLGAISGGLVVWHGWRSVGPPEEKWTATTLADYERRLQLTPAQVQKLKPAFIEAGHALKAVRLQIAQQVLAATKQLNDTVEPELTSAQKPLFEALLRERKQYREQLQQRLGTHPPLAGSSDAKK